MAKKAKKQTSPAEEQPPAAASSSNSAVAGPSGPPASSGYGGAASLKTSSKSPKNSQQEADVPTLIICRNKHWRYISCFHGPWPHMPIHVLEHMANINYNTPRPRPIDPATLFDLVKIRRLVDEATNLAVRAVSDISSPILTSVNGGLPGYESTSSFGAGGHGKLSKERRFRMREQASQKLARAYRLDEIICSVATMQGGSTLDNTGSVVLQRSPQDMDAKYIHFFHEKIPSRTLVESTSLLPLNEIISDNPNEGEVLRTRAMVKSLMRDYEGAIQDINVALQIHRAHPKPHGQAKPSTPQDRTLARKRNQDIALPENEQPSSYEGQLLFQRATAYLAWACQYVLAGVPPIPEDAQQKNNLDPDEHSQIPTQTNEQRLANDDIGPEELQKLQVEARKLVKVYAKRAIRDYMAFLGRFEYAPDVPVRVAEDFNERINNAAHGQKKPRTAETIPESEQYPLYILSDLFAPVPPSNLPPYPPEPTTPDSNPKIFNECMTYHPLLTEAMHSLLLTHCLVQTSNKELLRHANMVSRLVRLIDGYPIFQASRSPARSDWIEVVRRMGNWLQLTDSWEKLCAPAPLPLFVNFNEHDLANARRTASAAAALINGQTAGTLSDQDEKGPVNEPSPADFVFETAVRSEYNVQGLVPVKTNDDNSARPNNDFSAPVKNPPQKRGPVMSADGKVHSQTVRWSVDDAEYPFISERAVAITRWIREAPLVKGVGRRKKKPKKSQKPNNIEEGMEDLGLEDAEETATKSG